MGLSLGGLQSGSTSVASILASLVGQDVVARSFSASQASGSDAFKATVNGARWHIGAGASDYFSSDGTTITSAAPFKAVGLIGAVPANSENLKLTDTTNTQSFKLIVNNTTLTIYDTNTAAVAVFTLGGATSLAGSLTLSSYTDDSATPGNRTVNKVRGKNAIAIGAATCVITNSFVTANSQVLCTLEFADATATTILSCIPGAGSFTLTVNAAATAATKFSWVVLN
jgi:hypothetical protein